MADQRQCPACGGPLWKREGETPSAYAKRKTCGPKCGAKLRKQTRSDDTRYESRFGGGWLNANQYLAEGMCDRIARKDGRSLPLRFWETKEWKEVFGYQLLLSSRLLKRFSAQVIIRALRKEKRCWSLKAPFLLKTIQREHELWKQEKLRLAAAEPPPLPPPVIEKPRPGFVFEKSALAKLRELNHGESKENGTGSEGTDPGRTA